MIDVQPLMDAFGYGVGTGLMRLLQRAFSPHVRAWGLDDTFEAYGYMYETWEDEESLKQQMDAWTQTFTARHGVHPDTVKEGGTHRERFLNFVAEEYPMSSTGYRHRFRHTLAREDWPDVAALPPDAKRVHARLVRRLEDLAIRMDAAYREGDPEAEQREMEADDDGPPEPGLLLMLDGHEGALIEEMYQDIAEQYANQNQCMTVPLLLILDPEQEPLPSRVERFEAFLSSIETLDAAIRDVRAWMDELRRWLGQRDTHPDTGDTRLLPDPDDTARGTIPPDPDDTTVLPPQHHRSPHAHAPQLP